MRNMYRGGGHREPRPGGFGGGPGEASAADREARRLHTVVTEEGAVVWTPDA